MLARLRKKMLFHEISINPSISQIFLMDTSCAVLGLHCALLTPHYYAYEAVYNNGHLGEARPIYPAQGLSKSTNSDNLRLKSCNQILFTRNMWTLGHS